MRGIQVEQDPSERRPIASLPKGPADARLDRLSKTYPANTPTGVDNLLEITDGEIFVWLKLLPDGYSIWSSDWSNGEV